MKATICLLLLCAGSSAAVTWGQQPLTFMVRGETVAALVYDDQTKTCRVEGDIAAAFVAMMAELERVSEERDRLKWGDALVDQWKAEKKKLEAEMYRSAP